MKKLIVTLIVVFIGGCISNQPKIQYTLYKPVTYKPTIGKLSHQEMQTSLHNGALTVNGKKILEEEGDINSVYTINDKVFYFVAKKMPSEESPVVFILKSLEGKSIERFKGYGIIVTSSKDGLPLILVKLSQNSYDDNFYTFDNIYTFDGKKVTLLNKNVKMFRGSKISSNFIFTPILDYSEAAKERTYEGVVIVDIINGNRINIKMKRSSNTFMGMNMPFLTIIGAAGGNIVYTYDDINGDSVIEVQNAYTKETYTLVENSTVQFLKKNRHIVLRVIENNEKENESSVYIDLTTLKQININPSDYKEITVRIGHNTLGGYYSTHDRARYTPSTIQRSIRDAKNRNMGRILF